MLPPSIQYTLYGAVGLLATIVLSRIYRDYTEKSSSEPPFLPYWIPFIGHSLEFSNVIKIFDRAKAEFPDGKPYSLMLFGKRVYIFPYHKDVATIYRKSRALSFRPLIENFMGPAWDISNEGIEILGKEDEDGDTLFRNAHTFYREALKEGPELTELTVAFLEHLEKVLDDWQGTAQQPAHRTSLFGWSRSLLGKASTDAMFGPYVLKKYPDLLPSVWRAHGSFYIFINRVPRWMAREPYACRENVLNALTDYFSDDKNKEGCARMVTERERQLREKGMGTRDVAGCAYSTYAALVTNAYPVVFRMLDHIFRSPTLLERLRKEVAPAFLNEDGTPAHAIRSLTQLDHLLNHCPVLRATFNETLRLHSASTSNRMVMEDTVVAGYTLKKGRTIMCPSHGQHFHPDYFGSDVHTFNPDRFLEPVLPNGKPADPKMVRAFGGGVSLCSGRFFASNEVLSFVASVLWRWDIEPQEKQFVSIRQREKVAEKAA